MNKVTLAFVAALALVACSKKESEQSPASGSAVTTSGSAASAPSSDLPPECNEYKAAIEKLGNCDKLPAATRDGFKKSFEQTSSSWSSMSAEAKKTLATQCKNGLDAVMAAAKESCGW